MNSGVNWSQFLGGCATRPPAPITPNLALHADFVYESGFNIASLEQHERDTTKWLGSRFTEVHKWLDEFFPTSGSSHRKFRHHEEGIREAAKLFGESAADAARVHILRDCRNIPGADDYVQGRVDALGLPRDWPIAAYALYTEEAFSALVQYKLKGPTGILLWGFIGQEVAPLLPALTNLTPDEVKERLDAWQKAVEARNALPPLGEPEEPIKALPTDAAAHVSAMSGLPFFSQLSSQFGGFQFCSVPTDFLVTPLALIDYENIENLRPELQGEDELSIARFAFPQQLAVQLNAAVDLNRHSVSLVSRNKGLLVGGPQLNQTPSGIEVRFLVTSGAAIIMVSRIGNRLFLRSGIHRAYLLASLGVARIPCALVEEKFLSPISSSYPSFSNDVLTHARPPLLKDFFDDSLSLTATLRQTNKIVRVTAEELVVPVE